MIERVLKALETQDYTALAACFSKDGRYFDYCPALHGAQNYFVYGREAVEMFFRNRFVHQHFEIGSPRVEGPDQGSYFGAYDGPFTYARIRIEAVDEAGLIQLLVASPAADRGVFL